MIEHGLGSVSTVLCDLDGVVWLARDPLPGAVVAIERLRSSGRRVVFVTNNSAARLGDHVAALERVGVSAVGDVISSATAAAQLIGPGERVLVAGGPGVMEAVQRRGGVAVLNDGTRETSGSEGAPYDVVMVGLHREFDYARLATAAAALHGGARLIGTNSDSTYPTPHGLDPGGGSIVAAVAAAGEAVPTFAGKPHRPMGDAIAALIGDDFDVRTTVMVGDRPDTDGLMAQQLGCRFALVRSGVTSPDQQVDVAVPIAADLPDLAAVGAAIVA